MNKGDVVVVTSKARDKVTGEEYTYRWFGVVVRERRGVARAYSLTHGRPRQIMTDEAEVLPQDRWPDGVHALRAAAILRGEIDI